MTTNVWGITEFDEWTGLPSIPEGFFWRVVGPESWSEFYSVQLCTRARPTIWHRSGKVKIIDDHPVRRTDISENNIVDAACFIIAFGRGLKRHLSGIEPIRSDLLGEYPPNSFTKKVETS
jgi:hypothetical protein